MGPSHEPVPDHNDLAATVKNALTTIVLFVTFQSRHLMCNVHTTACKLSGPQQTIAGGEWTHKGLHRVCRCCIGGPVVGSCLATKQGLGTAAAGWPSCRVRRQSCLVGR